MQSRVSRACVPNRRIIIRRVLVRMARTRKKKYRPSNPLRKLNKKKEYLYYSRESRCTYNVCRIKDRDETRTVTILNTLYRVRQGNFLIRNARHLAIFFEDGYDFFFFTKTR